MAKLSDELKRILTGLAYQDVGEFLPMRDKMKVLGVGAAEITPPPPGKPPAVLTSTRRFALISDGRGTGAPLDYVIESCAQQGGVIDLLVHGDSTREVPALERRIRSAGIACNNIRLGDQPLEDIVDYICNHRSLVFLVAIADDQIATRLVNDVIPQRGGRLPVPLVLLEDRPSESRREQSVA